MLRRPKHSTIEIVVPKEEEVVIPYQRFRTTSVPSSRIKKSKKEKTAQKKLTDTVFLFGTSSIV
jgi:hypothetical protein